MLQSKPIVDLPIHVIQVLKVARLSIVKTVIPKPVRLA